MVVTKEEGAPLGPNIIQQLAYKLTHMYFNWPGTVRVPAPCQYAHKLVDLVGEHLHGQPSQELNDKLYFLWRQKKLKYKTYFCILKCEKILCLLFDQSWEYLLIMLKIQHETNSTPRL